MKKRRDAVRDALARLCDPPSSLLRNARGEFVVTSRSSPWAQEMAKEMMLQFNGVTKISKTSLTITRQHHMIL